MSLLKIDGMRVTKNLEITNYLAEKQDEYLTLPANIDKGVVAFAFKLNFWQRLLTLVNGRVYVYLATFGNKMQPIHVNVSGKAFEEYHRYAVEELGVEIKE